MVIFGKYPIQRIKKYLNVKRFEKYLSLKKERYYVSKINEGLDIYLDIYGAIQEGQKFDSKTGYALEVLKDFCLSHVAKLSTQGNISVYPLLMKKLNERKVTVTFSTN